MIRYSAFIAVFVFCGICSGVSAEAALDLELKKAAVTQGVTVYDLSLSGEGVQNKKKVYIINNNLESPKKILWLFHGFKPEGDPYAQSPMEFIARWDLVRLCKKEGYMLIAPDMGATMYPLVGSEDNGKISDMRWLKEAYKGLVFKKHRDVNVVLIGVSTGVEGAVKFSSMILNVGSSADSIIAFSGTYDFFSLEESTGEYRIHKYAFGDKRENLNVWRKENPMESLKKLGRTKLYLFCESNSIYRKQAEDLSAQRLANIELVDMLDYGKGYSHSWTFWGSQKVVKALNEILLK